MKSLASFVVIVLGLLLASTVADFPQLGSPTSPASVNVSKYYLTHAFEDTHVPNIVTAVLADYRGFDTMVETAVVFVACIAIMSILRRCRREKQTAEKRMDQSSRSLIICTASRILIPIMQLFALYVVAHGHHSPGGGFQGGVLLGASLILLALSHGYEHAFAKWKERSTVVLTAVGVLIFAGVGVVSMVLGANFLDYSVLSQILPNTDDVMARSHAMLIVEIGVAIAVMSAMFSIFVDLSSRGECERGL